MSLSTSTHISLLRSKLVLNSLLFILVAISFCFYAPCFYVYYNSDQAIHALMSADFKLPRDVYYWGQNRLGSLLPMVTYPFVKAFHIQPLYMISVIQYAFLLISACIMSRFLKNKWLKLSLFLLIFFPVSEYRAILLIGHPYSQQLLCGTLFLFFCHGFNKALTDNSTSLRLHKLIIFQFLAVLFFALGTWVSELNGVLFLIPLCYSLLNFRNLRNYRSFGLFIFLSALYGLLILILFLKLKHSVSEDKAYDQAFFFDHAKIRLEFGFMWAGITDTLLRRDGRFIDSAFYYLAILFLITFIRYYKPIQNETENKFVRAIHITCIITFLLLFFSSWNLRSSFCTRYYIPVLYLFIYAIFLNMDRAFEIRKVALLSGILLIFLTSYAFFYLNAHKGPGPFTLYSDFKELPKGTLIADYWDVYTIASVAPKKIIPVPLEGDLIRNPFILRKAFKSAAYYFIGDEGAMPDTLHQYYHTLVFSGQKYNCNGLEVLCYYRIR